MATHIALLRGVNLGSHKRIPMADFRDLLAGLGYGAVGTHLQSGNAVFTSPQPGSAVQAAIAEALSRQLGVTAEVILRSPARLAGAVAADPFGAIATDPAKHLLGFLGGVPTPASLAAVTTAIDAMPTDGDRYSFVGDHLYLWCPNGISRSPYFTVTWNKLGVTSTMRNWNTVNALLRMAAERDE